MNAYSQLSDAELVRKVQELMGYSVRPVNTIEPNNPPLFCLYHNGEYQGSDTCEKTEADAWSHAPSPLTDANVCMGLVDEMWDEIPKERRGDFILVRDAETGKWYCEAPIEHSVEWSECDKRERAVCEVYCQVKEAK